MSAAGPRFVDVPADRLLGMLREIGAKTVAAGGAFREGVQGREVYVDVQPRGCRAFFRVYTSLASGASAARDCGEDAIRIVLLAPVPEGERALGESRKILRTAPKAAEDRVAAFLERLQQQLRVAYADVREVPTCPACGRLMALRESRHGAFWGCIGYPVCRQTRRAA